MIFQCPKNFKRGKYLFRKYRWVDLAILFGCGCGGLFLALAIVSIAASIDSFGVGLFGLIAGVLIMLVGGLLTLPINHYHNVLEWLNTVIDFYSRTRKFIWIGFRWSDDEDDIKRMDEEDDEFEKEE